MTILEFETQVLMTTALKSDSMKCLCDTHTHTHWLKVAKYQPNKKNCKQSKNYQK